MFNTYLKNLQTALEIIECTYKDRKIETSKAVEEVVYLIGKLRNAQKTIFWIGNGGSAAIAIHSTLDYFRTGNIKTRAFYDGAMITCLGNDFGYQTVFQKPLELFATRGDMLFAISSSGKSMNIIQAVEAAQNKKCFVVTLTGFEPTNPLRVMGDMNFYVPVNHYGYVELAHGILCHGFLDLLCDQSKRKKLANYAVENINAL
jgi:D-sedoheptulose 7-phosphate isomerase